MYAIEHPLLPQEFDLEVPKTSWTCSALLNVTRLWGKRKWQEGRVFVGVGLID